jgi:hypothetical protein
MTRTMVDRREASRERRRNATRVRCACLAWVEGGDESLRASGIARTVDVSARGVGLVLSRTFEIGSHIVVEFILAGSLRLRGEGEVAHRTELAGGHCRVGVSFFSAPVLVDRGL